jgi:hypothetical protein
MKVNKIPENIRDALSYNPETGSITWKHNKTKMDGKEAGNINEKGYRRIKFNGIRLRAHRIAWYLYYGEDPPNEIDHINGCTSDNRICNLRLANQFQNAWNKKLSRLNTSGVKGVYFNKRHKKWYAKITANRKEYCLGFYIKFKDAVKAVLEGRKRLHMEFANFATKINIDEIAH